MESIQRHCHQWSTMFPIAEAPSRHVHFVTGKLAAKALRHVVEEMAKKLGFSYSIEVLPITVAALMTARWVAKHLRVPPTATDVVIPGFVGTDLETIQATTIAKVHLGPKDLRDLPEFFSGKKISPPDLAAHRIEILAEINHAPRLSLDRLLEIALEYQRAGADVIDLGCDPGQRWADVETAVRELVAAGLRVSIDSFDPEEVAAACRAGASLVLSVNCHNVHLVTEWSTEVVVIPETPSNLASLEPCIELLDKHRIPFRLDPILEPIGLGLADSLVRYHYVRRTYPEIPMMMGIGNLTELTDVDSAGINLLLLGICAELRIGSVLTTQVIPWAQTSIAECDLARRIVHYAVENSIPPKRVSESLVMLRDPKLRTFPLETLQRLAATIRDPNYRLYAQEGQIHLISAGLHLHDADPFRLFGELMQREQSANVDPSHAFYLGFEMAKAMLALQLGKQYEQDRELQWGFLTRQESHHRLKRDRRKPKNSE